MLASGAKSLALMEEGGVLAKDGLVLVGEAFKQGFRSAELMDLARAIKNTGATFRKARPI
ncbi:MAG: hypothetical protein C4293_11160 [Nitrospiraceae bacterium]